MCVPKAHVKAITSHPARGGWIEIIFPICITIQLLRPTPHGVGGLKLSLRVCCMYPGRSHPARGGWIEILFPATGADVDLVPPRTGWVD